MTLHFNLSLYSATQAVPELMLSVMGVPSLKSVYLQYAGIQNIDYLSKMYICYLLKVYIKEHVYNELSCFVLIKIKKQGSFDNSAKIINCF